MQMQTIDKALRSLPLVVRPRNIAVLGTRGAGAASEVVPAVRKVLVEYPTASDFMAHYPPALSSRAAACPDKAFFGKAPTLAALSGAYGQREVAKWLSLLVYDVIAASGASSELKTPKDASRRVAETVAAEFPWLNAAEMLLFTHRLKAGRYGRFYGGFSQIDYCNALRQFLSERADAYARHERETTAERIATEMQGTVTREEYEAIKQRADSGDKEAKALLIRK